MMTDEQQLTMNEAVELIMQRTGMSRRNARRSLVKKLADGSLPATGFLITRDGEHLGKQTIPADFWRNATWDEEH